MEDGLDWDAVTRQQAKEEWKSTLKTLENDYPPDKSKLTAQDVIDLSAIDAALTASKKYTNEETDIQPLEYLQNKILLKIARLTAYQALRNAERFPHESWIHEGVVTGHIIDSDDEEGAKNLTQQVYEILNPIKGLFPEGKYIEDEDGTYYEPTLLKVDDALNNLRSMLAEEDAPPEVILAALKCVPIIERRGIWKDNARYAKELFEKKGNVIVNAEQILQSIHEGAEESLTRAREEQRPVLEEISDRPWEVANALVANRNSLLNAQPAHISKEVRKFIMPFSEDPNVNIYLQANIPSDKDVEELINEVNNKSDYFKAALTFNKSIPFDAQYEHRNIDPDKDYKIIDLRDHTDDF